MISDSVSTKRSVMALAADGCVVTAGAFALLGGVGFGLDAAGRSGALAGFIMLLGFFVGPIVTWWLAGREMSLSGALALVAGFILSGLLVSPVVFLGPLLQWFVALFTDAKYAGAILYLLLVLLVFFAAIAWRGIETFRDLTSGRSRLALDLVRIVSTLAIIVFSGFVAAMMINGQDALEAEAFVLLAGATGAAVVTMAAVAAWVIQRFREGRPPRAATSA